MDFPRNACPIVYTCLQKYQKLSAEGKVAGIFGDAGVYLNPWRSEWWQDLEEEAATNRVSEEQTLLRAFFALEVIYSDLLHRQAFIANADYSDVLREHFCGLKVERSPSGLKELLGHIHAYTNKAKAAVVTIVIKQQPSAHLKSPIRTLEILAHSCEVLSGCLRRNDFKCITLVGEDLAECLAETCIDDSYVEELMKVLLTVGVDNPIHAWEATI